MTVVLNLLWLVFGGLVAGVAWFFSAILLALTVVGLPWAAAAARIGLFTLWPFGRRVVDRSLVSGRQDLGTGPIGFLLNVIWFLLGGWYLALAHLVAGVVLMLLIVTIPFGLQHFKLARIALAPVGVTIVDA
ncbi:MAG: YccF domain-containing protein [Caulobacteraceae bacterium]|nr:YccF domain-containing protein [Caulobacteraceae bacterium]